MNDFHVELAGCEGVLLREIGDPKMKRKDVAQTYGLTLRSSERERVDWGKVNRAIIERWSDSALEWIKTQAHSGKCFAEAKYDAALKKAVADGDTGAAGCALLESLGESEQ